MGRVVSFTWSHTADEILGRLEGKLKEKIYGSSKRIFDSVVRLTPVRTGFARASWDAAINGAPYPKLTVKVDGGTMSAPTFPIAKNSVRVGDRIFIRNTAPYIVPLEYGWSQQAPAGMLRVTLAKYGVGTSVRI